MIDMMISRRELFGLAAGGALLRAQEGGQRPVFRVKVDLVVLSFTVTDSKNNYINGLKPADFRIFEDGILQKMNTFAEGARPPLLVTEDGKTQPLIEGAKDAGSGRPDARSQRSHFGTPQVRSRR